MLLIAMVHHMEETEPKRSRGGHILLSVLEKKINGASAMKCEACYWEFWSIFYSNISEILMKLASVLTYTAKFSTETIIVDETGSFPISYQIL